MKTSISVLRYLGAILALPLLAMLKLMRRILRVRVLVVGSQRFGHLALEPEMWLANQDKGTKRGFPLEIQLWSFGSSRNQSNKYLADLWAQRIRYPPSWVTGALVRGGELFGGLALDRPSLSVHGPENALDLKPLKCPQPAGFSDKELESLLSVGFDPRQPYVAIVVRDAANYTLRGERENPNNSLFNANLSTYVAAIEHLVEANLQVIRLGGPSSQRLPLVPRCLDYANSSVKSDELDVKLAWFCKFAVSSQTGPDAVALLGRRPVLYVDVLRFSQFFFGTRLATWCPMRVMNSDDGRYWSLRELCASELIMAKRPEDFIRTGLEFVRSDAAQIKEYVADYLDELTRPANSRIWAMRSHVNRAVQRAMGDAGRRRFGNIAAPVSRYWLESQGSWWLESLQSE